MGHWKPFRDVRERRESTSAAASTLFSDRPEPLALTTVFPLVSQDRLGKPQPEGHPLRGRLPFIVWVHLHLPTHCCVSQSSPVSHVSRKPSQPSPRPAFDWSSACLDRLTKSNLRSQRGLGGDGHGSQVSPGPTEFYPVIPRSPAGATP